MKRLIIIMAIIGQNIFTMEHVPEFFKNLPKGVQVYMQSLPKIASCDEPNQKSQIITDYLIKMGGYVNTNIAGRDILQAKIDECIVHNKPIYRCMPGFPVASANANKIPFDDKHSFSMGDFVGLLTRNHISCEIAKVHKPGSCMAIYWESFIYDLNRICEKKLGYPQYPKERIVAYQNSLKEIVKHFEPKVQLGKLDADTINEIYAKNYAQIPVKVDPEKIHDYEMFMKEDLDSDIWLERSERRLFEQQRVELEKKYTIKEKSYDQIKSEPVYKKIKAALGARKYLHSVASDIAEGAFNGGQRMALLIEKEVPDYSTQIRESVRPDCSSIAKKIGTPIIFGAKGTPWHKVLVVNSNGVNLASYKKIVDEQEMNPEIIYYRIGGCELGYVNSSK